VWPLFGGWRRRRLKCIQPFSFALFSQQQKLTFLWGGEMRNQLVRLWREEEGQDLTEYGLLLLFIAMLSIAVVQGLGSVIENVFSNASASIS